MRMANARKADAVPFSNIGESTGFQQRRSYLYFARDGSRKESVFPSPTTLVFPKWEFGLGLRPKQISFRAHYRERSRSLLRADVTKTGNLSVENFCRQRLAVGLGPLAGGNIHWFGQTEGEPTALFETNHASRMLVGRDICQTVFPLRNRAGSSISFDEKAGGLDCQVRTREVDRIKGEPDISTIVPDAGCLGGLHSSCNADASRHQLISFDYYRFVDNGLESSFRAWILSRYRGL